MSTDGSFSLSSSIFDPADAQSLSVSLKENTSRTPDLPLHPSAQTNPARTLLSIDDDVRQMDALYSVNFCTWVKSPNNLQHTSRFLQRFMAEYDAERMAFGISWIISGWTLRASAELLLRSFSVWGVGHSNVGKVVSSILDRFESEYARLELCSAIVAFESAESGAGFFRHLTRNWSCHRAVCTFVKYALRKLAWTTGYFRQFMLQFCMLTETDLGPEVGQAAHEKRTTFVQEMLKRYDQSVAANHFSAQQLPLYGSGTTLKYFCYVFEEFVRETQCIIARSLEESRRPAN